MSPLALFMCLKIIYVILVPLLFTEILEAACEYLQKILLGF